MWISLSWSALVPVDVRAEASWKECQFVFKSFSLKCAFRFGATCLGLSCGWPGRLWGTNANMLNETDLLPVWRHSCANDGCADHTGADHGGADDGCAEHRRANDGRADDCSADHPGADHRRAVNPGADYSRPDHGCADNGCANHCRTNDG